MSRRLRVAIMGATGVAGQQFVAALSGHPWFEISTLVGSDRSAGKTYMDALQTASGAVNWHETTSIPKEVTSLSVVHFDAFDPGSADLVFSALDSEVARLVEPRVAKDVPVFSLASAFRDAVDIPLVIPGVNPEQLEWIPAQQQKRAWKGFLVTTPNCTATGLCITLKPILTAFGLERVMMTSLQACSGAGRASGVLGLDILDNVIPHIPGEEEKVVRETQKILGKKIPISCLCTRVPVLDGHTEAVYVQAQNPISLEGVRRAWEQFGTPEWHSLPSSGSRMIRVHENPFRPQPRLDRDEEQGMITHVGRLAIDENIGPHGLKYLLLSHNTKMGAARGALLLAEYMVRQKMWVG